jgi:RNA polymerase sigma-70 factor (ECF subfamily)
MSGDGEAFARIVDERRHRMTRLAVGILGRPGDADDALQDALVGIWRGLPNLRDPGKFDAWSDRILVNACRRVLRTRRRDHLRSVSLEPDEEQLPPAAARDDVGDRDALERAFETLSAEDRAAIVLHHLEGRPLESIAVILEVPIGTLKARLHRARHAMRRAIEEDAS